MTGSSEPIAGGRVGDRKTNEAEREHQDVHGNASCVRRIARRQRLWVPGYGALDEVNRWTQHHHIPLREVIMPDQAMQLFPEGPRQMGGTLIPALKGCPDCRTVQMIASPELGVCVDCGAAMRVLSASEI
jgi:hypothetical protein